MDRSDTGRGDPVLDLEAGEDVLAMGDGGDRVGAYAFMLHRADAPVSIGQGAPEPARLGDGGAAMGLYLDGARVAERPLDEPLRPVPTTLLIGAAREFDGGPGNRMRGAIDEFRFWSRAQSSQDIAARRMTRITDRAAGLARALGFSHGPDAEGPVDSAAVGLVASYPARPGTGTQLFRVEGALMM